MATAIPHAGAVVQRRLRTGAADLRPPQGRTATPRARLGRRIPPATSGGCGISESRKDRDESGSIRSASRGSSSWPNDGSGSGSAAASAPARQRKPRSRSSDSASSSPHPRSPSTGSTRSTAPCWNATWPTCTPSWPDEKSTRIASANCTCSFRPSGGTDGTIRCRPTR